MISAILEQAILASQADTPIAQLDIMTHSNNINLIAESFHSVGGELKELNGELKEIQEAECIYQRPEHRYTKHDHYYEILTSTIILNTPFSKGMYKYVRQALGAQNNTKNIDYYFEEKAGSLIIPFELISTTSLASIPSHISIESAFAQNPFHPCFTHKLIPSPVVGVAVHHKLESLMGFIAHPRLLIEVLGASLSNESELSLSYDTKLALNLLNLKYGIFINEKVVKALEKLDDDLMTADKLAYFNIEGDW